MDFDALEAAGVANARAHAPLIEYLSSLGFTCDEMVEADRDGRLFALAGDALIRSGRPRFSLRTAATTLQMPLEEVEHIWAAFGLTVAGPDDVSLSDKDVTTLRTCAKIRTILGDDAAFGLLRVMGVNLARIAEAQLSATRSAAPDLWLTSTGDELATARAYRSIAEVFPDVLALIDAVFRRHVRHAGKHMEAVLDESVGSVVCGVGFADLAEFTARTQTLASADLSRLLSSFSSVVNEVAHSDGVRVVKFIGDAVMWVASSPRDLVQVAVEIAKHPKLRNDGVHVRAGLAFGTVLDLDGDYFGHAVNLAARLTAAAAPGEILVSENVRAAIPDSPATPRGDLVLKGIDEPVTAYALHT
jgi:class 3 adenylate cyclase